MRASLLLADAAQAADGKLWILGGGWTITGPGAINCAVAIDIKLDWHELNIGHTVKLELYDAAGEPVLLPQPDGGEMPVMIESWFKSAPSPEMRPGGAIGTVLAFTFLMLQLASASDFVWRLSVDGQSHPDWYVGFSTREEAHAKAA
jgi:hypothetical protein